MAIADTIVRGRGRLEEQPSHVQRRVAIVDPSTGERLDDALCSVMRAPRSYTGEDVVELSCHGSPALLRGVVERLCAHGARLATPGEFTRRAFLHGRIDLAQAEAVSLLISARTERAVTLAARGMAGELGRRLRSLRERLLDLVAGLEVALDFPEDGVVGTEPRAAAAAVRSLAAEVVTLSDDARRGRIVHEGVTVALVGAPNAGKSSLLNALVGRERAIVSPIAGTTRDVIEATIDLGGIPIRLLDTAGMGLPRDAVEAEGIRRSRKAMDESEALLVVVDGSCPPTHDVLGETADRPRIVVRSKSDLPADPVTAMIDHAVDVSAVTGAGLGRLSECLCRLVMTSADGGGALVASLRQMEALEALHGSLIAAHRALDEAPVEVALVELRDALGHVSSLVGLDVGDAVLDRIFATFCLGK